MIKELKASLNKEALEQAPLRVKIAVVFLVLYLISPIDLIPDFIPVIGQLDDILVAGLALRYIQKYTNLKSYPQA